jgi:hypothetical protein
MCTTKLLHFLSLASTALGILIKDMYHNLSWVDEGLFKGFDKISVVQ